jgi:hypothetical protein
MPVNGVNASFGIDFRHAVEFSRIGRTPRPDLSAGTPGQPALLYRTRSTESRPDFLTFHPHGATGPSQTTRFGSASLGGFGATGRFRVPRLAPTRRTLRGFQVAGQIGSRWAESHGCNLLSASTLWECGGRHRRPLHPPATHASGSVSYPPTTPEPLQKNAFRGATPALHPAAGRRTPVRTRRPSPSRC